MALQSIEIIQKAEQKGQIIIENANKEKEDMLKKVQIEADDLVEKQKATSEQEKSTILSKMQEKINIYQNEKNEEIKIEVDEIKKQASMNKNKAIDEIISIVTKK